MKTMVFIPLLIVLADQAIKVMVRQAPLGVVFFRLDGILEITHSANTGAAFSLLSGQTALVTLTSAILLVLMLCFVLRSMRLTGAGRGAFACLMGGGISNLIDRAAYSHVTDYIRVLFVDFPIFNLADIFITCSIAALLVLLLRDRLEEDTGEKHGANC